jgi:hypothetical protein
MTADTYPITVESVGTFECRRRTLRVEIKIGAEFSRLTEGEEKIPSWLRELCEVVSTVKVLVAKGPDGFDVDAMDPQDEETFGKLMAVYSAITAAEARFRTKPEIHPQA